MFIFNSDFFRVGFYRQYIGKRESRNEWGRGSREEAAGGSKNRR